MFRRKGLAIVCVGLAGTLVLVCTLVVLNFVQLARAQGFVHDFVSQAINEGSAMPMPDIAPSAEATLTHATLVKLLDRARRIGPLVMIQAVNCAAQARPDNLCAGQLLACVVEGYGQSGAFQADIAMCRDGNFAPYRLAASKWSFQFTNGDPGEQQDQSPI